MEGLWMYKLDILKRGDFPCHKFSDPYLPLSAPDLFSSPFSIHRHTASLAPCGTDSPGLLLTPIQKIPPCLPSGWHPSPNSAISRNNTQLYNSHEQVVVTFLDRCRIWLYLQSSADSGGHKQSWETISSELLCCVVLITVWSNDFVYSLSDSSTGCSWWIQRLSAFLN